MNSKNSILLVDPDFDPNAVADCSLLIKITADSFSYAIIDKSCNQIKAVYDQQECRDTAEDLSVKLKNDSYLNLPFKEIKAAVYTENTIAVPDELFDADDLNKYAQYFIGDFAENLYVRPVASYGFTAVFNLSPALEETLNQLNNCRRYDHAAPLLLLSQTMAKNSLSFDFTAGSFHVSFVKENQPVFQKYFQIENSEEFNYYLLFIISQLKINAAETSVYLSGIIHEDDANYRCITKYFSTISFTEAVSNEMDSRVLDDMPAHYYSSLLALDLCE